MPETSSISRFRRKFPKCFKPSSSSSLSPTKISLISPQTPIKCDVAILDSRSISVTPIVSDLYSHLKTLGVSVSFSGDESIFLASVCILVLSKDFADSNLRLQELKKLHDCKIDLIPIFFDVRPSEVRKVVKGVFQDAFSRVRDENPNYDDWKVAFEITALLSGWKFSDFLGNSRKLLKAVVQSVMKKVNSASLQVAKYPVGLTDKTKKLGRLLEAGSNSSKTRVLGIVGMGGIGKTTLAKEFFNTIKTHFKAACFIEDVKGKVETIGLERVQSLLLKDLLQIDHQIHSTNQGKYLLKKCLNRAEVIIVFDNIDDPDHLDALWVPEFVHKNSIVLITTRDMKLIECVSNSLIYNMEGLERKFARELFCWHAFVMPLPSLGFDPLVERFISYCDGLPLSLETLGGKLFGEGIPAWEETLKNISESLPGDIERQIRVSYDALDLSEKQIFLDIALFFVGEDTEMTIRIWNAMGWFGSVGVQSLQQKCLIKVDNGKFQMHDQLRQMAEKIVDGENTNNPGLRSRLWRPNDVMTVLSLQSGSENVQGITLTKKQIQDERLGSVIVPKSEIIRDQYGRWPLQSFAPMTELRLLILEDACVEGDFRVLSKNIIWLRWRHCPSGPLPMELPFHNLRILDLSGGKLSSLWSDSRQIPVQLEELNLRGCVSLRKFPVSIKLLNRLEKLILSHCISLVDIPDGFCDIYTLKYVDVSGCTGLISLPDRLGNWKRLQHLDLSNCKNLEFLPSSFGGLEKLEHLNLGGCSKLSKLPSSFHKLEEITYLNLQFCWALESEKDISVGLSKLEFLDASLCKRIHLPNMISFQHCIKTLKISCSHFKVLPSSLGELENLEELSLWQGYEVKTLDPFVFTKLIRLKDLVISQFSLLEGLGSSLGHLRQLKSLYISFCGILDLPEEIGYLDGLERLIIFKCSKLAKLPTTAKGLSALTSLSLTECSSLQLTTGAFPNMSTITKIHLGNCVVTDQLFQFICDKGIALKELELLSMRLPSMKGIGCGPFNIASFSISSCSNISSFEIPRGLPSLKIEDCPGLKKVIVPVHNTTLQTLHLGNCKNLLTVDSIENLKYLKSLNLNGCFDLRTIAGLEKLNKLSELHLFLSDWYLSHDTEWLKKALNTAKIPHTVHLSAKVELEKCDLDLVSCFQKITQQSQDKFKFKLPYNSRKLYCGIVICFIARHSLFKNMVSRPNERKDISYQSVHLRLVNGANDTEICQYKIPEAGSFFHVSIFMDEFLVSEIFADGSELVIPSSSERVYGAWIFLVPAYQKHLAGEVACKLIDNLEEHKSAIGGYVSRSELDLKRLEDEFSKVMTDMDFNGIHALGLANYWMIRTYSFNEVPIYAELIGSLLWKKRRQILFEVVDTLKYLDLELGNGCRNLVENPVINSYEACVNIGNSKISTNIISRKHIFPPDGCPQNYLSLDRITLSHKAAFKLKQAPRFGSAQLTKGSSSNLTRRK